MGCSAVIKNFFDDHIHQFVTSPVANDTLTTIQLPLVKASLFFGARIKKEYNWIVYNFVEVSFTFLAYLFYIDNLVVQFRDSQSERRFEKVIPQGLHEDGRREKRES